MTDRLEILAKELTKAIMPEIERGREIAMSEIARLREEVKRVEGLESRTRAALDWMEERAKNSTSFGHHCHAYEVAARHLKLALDGDDIDGMTIDEIADAVS